MTTSDSQPDRYALVGHPVEHSRSPLIHQLFARQTGQAITYELIDAEPKSFETAVRGFMAAGGKGMNVTVPHKEAAFEVANEVSTAAHQAGAVNTLTFFDSRIRGDNTDGVGFIRDVRVNLHQQLEGRRVLILGAGGAARGIVAPLLESRVGVLVIANRTIERAQILARHFAGPEELHSMTFEQLATLDAFDVVVNATSAGLKGETPPFPGSVIGRTTFCYDLVYSLKTTPFVSWAREHGAERAVQGWGMLVEQAAESFYIWRGVRPDTGPILKQLVV